MSRPDNSIDDGTEPAEPTAESAQAPAPESIQFDAAAVDAPGRADQTGPQTSDAVAAPSPQRLAELEAERAELHDRLLRVTADYQNYVRRSGQNITDACEQQSMEIAKSLITVLDHFDRALEIDTQVTTTANLLEGVQSIRDELVRALDRFGVQRLVVATGDLFDPNCHEALMRQPVEGVKSDHVAELLRPGYTLAGKTIRPAQVSVAK